MTRDRQVILATALLIATLTAVNIWSYLHMTEAKTSAIRAAIVLREDQALVENIARRSRQKAVVGNRELPEAEFAKQIERGAIAAQLPTESILRIAPEPARRVGASPFLDKPTQVLLKNATLVQLFSFLQAMSQAEPSLQARGIHLITPRDGLNGNQWTVELDLAYRIYSPKAESAQGRKTP